MKFDELLGSTMSFSICTYLKTIKKYKNELSSVEPTYLTISPST